MARYHRRPDWDERRQDVTPEEAYLNRRQWLRWAGLAGLGAAAVVSSPWWAAAREGGTDDIPGLQGDVPDEIAKRYPAKRIKKYAVQRELTPYRTAATYNNFYEFSSSSKTAPARMVEDWDVRPWEVEITGLVKKKRKLDADDLQKLFPLEERVYRFRCVEAWAMTVPWTGFPLRKLIEKVEPHSDARYVRFVSFLNPDKAPGQKNDYFPWPYYEALRMDEAMNELTLCVTGLYGKPLPKQNGAPLRMIVPWKYGYKGAKSVVKIEFVKDRPGTFWNDLAPTEYGFLSNVNPNKPHPRWSQKTERLLAADKRVPTRLYNGYGEYVAGLYK